MPAHSARSYLAAAPKLQSLLQEAQRLQMLQNAWSLVVQTPLSAASSVGALRGQTLVIFANNGAVAAKLRQLAPSLLAKIQERGFEVTAIQVDVQVTTQPAARKKKDLALNSNALSNLDNLAQSLAESPLKSALQALVQRHSKTIKD